MTRNPIPALALAASLSLAGCATTGPGSVGDIIARAQSIARMACGFMPAVNTVSAILNNGILTTADGIANAICAAVAPRMSSKRSGPPMVGNVIVRGSWVK